MMHPAGVRRDREMTRYSMANERVRQQVIRRNGLLGALRSRPVSGGGGGRQFPRYLTTRKSRRVRLRALLYDVVTSTWRPLHFGDRLEISFANVHPRKHTCTRGMYNEICFPDIPILPRNNLSPYECCPARNADNAKRETGKEKAALYKARDGISRPRMRRELWRRLGEPPDRDCTTPFTARSGIP